MINKRITSERQDFGEKLIQWMLPLFMTVDLALIFKVWIYCSLQQSNLTVPLSLSSQGYHLQTTRDMRPHPSVTLDPATSHAPPYRSRNQSYMRAVSTLSQASCVSQVSLHCTNGTEHHQQATDRAIMSPSSSFMLDTVIKPIVGVRRFLLTIYPFRPSRVLVSYFLFIHCHFRRKITVYLESLK